ncbi:Tetratricopeptide repeat-containing protein [Nannocystis exedens]|uniref:Tetratricopeptide repeat-containing protein n=1 Tax=Nannocystis exedens TaxID=54 RepID=A0A1I2IQD6_9BACT|nr:tetratricopeptide repeat protein [Nannocystis exedens]PCC69280.1 Tetratricopeptide repeat protein [Nannocystis exedens]SFF44489.1 Tetratricopeptide repeat-containing protein [Nannocystis exedens]
MVTLMVAAAIGAVIVIGMGLLAPSAQHEAPCGDQLVDTVWNTDARAAFARQFAAVAPERSAATLTSITSLIAHWTDAWRLQRRSACTAGAARAARVSCLDRQLGELRAQLAVWEKADASVVDHATAAAAALPSPAECVEARTTTSPASASLLASTAMVDALQRSGRWEEARVHAPAVLAQAERSTELAPKALAMLAVARVELDVHARTAARDHAIAAARAASNAREDDLLAGALLVEAAALIDDHRAADALGVCDAVEAFAARGLPRSERIEIVRADALLQLGRTDEAIVHYRRVIARLAVAAARDPARRLALASAIGSLGSALGKSERIAEGAVELRRALEIEEAALGPQHPEVGRTLHDLAILERENGDIEDAERHFGRARAMLAVMPRREPPPSRRWPPGRARTPSRRSAPTRGRSWPTSRPAVAIAVAPSRSPTRRWLRSPTARASRTRRSELSCTLNSSGGRADHAYARPPARRAYRAHARSR